LFRQISYSQPNKEIMQIIYISFAHVMQFPTILQNAQLQITNTTPNAKCSQIPHDLGKKSKNKYMKYSYKRRFRKDRKTRMKKGGKKDWDRERDDKEREERYDIWDWEKKPYKKYRSTKRRRKYDRK